MKKNLIPGSVKNMAMVAKQQIDDTTKKAKDIVDEISTATITKDLATRTQNAFSGRNPEDILVDSRLSSTFDSVKKGTAEAETKVKNLMGSSQEALSQPVSFLTKMVKEVFGNAATPMDMIGGLDTDIKNISKNTLENIAKRAGLDGISNTSDLNSAIDSITKMIESKMNEGSGILSKLEGSLNAKGLLSNALSTAEEILGPVNRIQSSIDSLLAEGKGLLDIALSKLPADITSKITPVATSLLNEILDGSKLRMTNTTNMASDLFSKFDVDYLGIVDKLNSFGDTYTHYPRYSDEEGNFVPGISNRNDLSNSQISTVYSLAKQYLCGQVRMPSLHDFASAKDLYDLLLMFTGMFGLSDLLSSLIDCDRPYHDGRSERILNDVVRPAAVSKGDPFLYKAYNPYKKIAYDKVDDLRTLNSNMVLRNYDGSGKQVKKEYNDLLQNSSINVNDLVRGNKYSSINSINSNHLVSMCASNTEIIDEGITKDTRLLGTQLYAKYA